MTTLSQFIGPEEDFSLSFHSTPGFNDDDQKGQKKKHINPKENIMKECEQQSKKNKDFTPQSLLEKLRDFKYEKENRLQNYTLRQPLSFSSKSRFSLISLKNPAFKLLEDIKKERFSRLTNSGLGWYDKTLYEDKGLGELYHMPDQNAVVDYESWPNKSNTKQPYGTQNVTEIFKKSKKNRISFSSNTIIDQIIAQSTIIEEEQDKQNCQKSLKELNQKILQKSIKVDVEIQTGGGYQTENLGKLSFQQLSNQIIKHLTVLESINNTLLTESNANKKNHQKSQTLLISQECQKVKETDSKSLLMDQSKYFKLSQSQFVMTPAQKLKLLQKFNKQQNEMFKKLFESMISYQSPENSKIFVFRDIQKKPQNDSQFGNLQKLMRDRGMKESIVGSNQGYTSFNSESSLSIVDSEITEQFQKFNPDTLKKINNNEQ